MKHASQVGVYVLTLLVLAGCSEEAPQAEAPRPVRTLIVSPVASGEEIVQTGDIQPHTETDLGFRIEGRVATREVELAAIVRKGQLLATLVPQDVRNEVRATEADVESALSAETLAKSAMDRQRMLFEKQIAAAAKVEEADANWRSAVARREAAQATLENVRNKLDYTRLLAPDDGIISAVAVNAGQVVTAGQTVFKLASLGERDAAFDVSEKLINTVPPDVVIEVALTSDPRISTRGKIRDVSPTADPSTRSYRVRVTLPDAPKEMAFGAAVTGRVVLPGAALVSLPASALTSGDGDPAVLIVDPASHLLARKPIKVARYSADRVFVSDGLLPGEAVVTAGVSKLRPGQKVAFPADAAGEKLP